MSNVRLFFEINFYQEQERERFPRRRDGSCTSELFGSNYLPPLPSLSKSDRQWANHGCLQKDGQQLTFFLLLHLTLYTFTLLPSVTRIALQYTCISFVAKLAMQTWRKTEAFKNRNAKDGDIKRTPTVCMPHALRTVNGNVLSRGRIKCVYTSSAY